MQLFNCVSQLVQHDKEVEVRRAAVLLLKLLLQGLDTDALKVSPTCTEFFLPGFPTRSRWPARLDESFFSFQVLEPIIRDVYRLLKAVVVRDSDDSVTNSTID